MNPRAAVALVLFTAGNAGCRCDKDNRHNEHQHPEPSEIAPLRAALNAPEGATPCETAWNALSALDEACVAANMPAPWPVMPKRAEFFDVCQRMPAEMQRCLAPKYNSLNNAKCKQTTEEMKTDEWGKLMRKMLNSDGSAPIGSGSGLSKPAQ